MQNKPVCRCDDLFLEKKPDSYRIIVEKFNLVKCKSFLTNGFNYFNDSIQDADILNYFNNEFN
jgi:hypothetical protein